MIEKPRIAPHGRSIIISLRVSDSGLPEEELDIASAQELSANLRAEALSVAAFLDDAAEPFVIGQVNEGLILRKERDNRLTACSLYPREKAKGRNTADVYLTPALALRLSDALRAWATGREAPRVRARNAPGAKAPK